MALYWRDKTLLAKIETVYGTDPAPTGAANAILAKEITLSPMEGTDVSRELELPNMGAQPTIAAELHATLKFRVELQASGSLGVAPAWGPLMRACSFAQTIVATTSVTYNPITTGQESVTLYLNVGGTLFNLKGARGDVTLMLDAQGIPHLEFTFTGLWVAPAAQAKPAVTLSGFVDPTVATTANTPVFTLDAFTPKVRNFKLAAGNQVERRFLIGSEEILITDHAEQVEFQIEAEALATWNPFSLALSGTPVALTMRHGTAAGRRCTVNVPKLQIQRPQSLAVQQNVVEWALRGVPLPTAGNDQWTLALT